MASRKVRFIRECRRGALPGVCSSPSQETSYRSHWTISEPNDAQTALGRVSSNCKSNKTGFSTLDHYDEAVTLAREQYHAARRALGPDRDVSLSLAHAFAMALTCAGPQCAPRTLTDFREAESVLIDALPRFRRVMGNLHPSTRKARNLLDKIKSRLQEVA